MAQKQTTAETTSCPIKLIEGFQEEIWKSKNLAQGVDDFLKKLKELIPSEKELEEEIDELKTELAETQGEQKDFGSAIKAIESALNLILDRPDARLRASLETLSRALRSFISTKDTEEPADPDQITLAVICLSS